ncbi:hypothetical protein ABZT04_43590 [Streptomyces sp. NPDC005492]|uniref:hypothetical protein n=1 Tax=Streptomyces sp. NPDC005492 TaxID=3156883 RepID=UPI0033AE998B
MRNRVAILAAAAALSLTGATALGAVSQAAAATPGPVVVTGTVDDCADGGSPTKVSIKTSKETKADTSGVKNSNEYSVTFKKIPTTGRNATATVTCDTKDTYTQDFRIDGAPGAAKVTQTENLEP